MSIEEWQKTVDKWIKKYGVRYFDIKTNTLLLSEELGELARLIARRYGEQSFKNNTPDIEVDAAIKDEIGDMLFVLTCISNQLNINLEEVVKDNMEKKTNRDATRHRYLSPEK